MEHQVSHSASASSTCKIPSTIRTINTRFRIHVTSSFPSPPSHQCEQPPRKVSKKLSRFTLEEADKRRRVVNSQERSRQGSITEAFNRLQECLPDHSLLNYKKNSKIWILETAEATIRLLEHMNQQRITGKVTEELLDSFLKGTLIVGDTDSSAVPHSESFLPSNQSTRNDLTTLSNASPSSQTYSPGSNPQCIAGSMRQHHGTLSPSLNDLTEQDVQTPAPHDMYKNHHRRTPSNKDSWDLSPFVYHNLHYAPSPTQSNSLSPPPLPHTLPYPPKEHQLHYPPTPPQHNLSDSPHHYVSYPPSPPHPHNYQLPWQGHPADPTANHYNRSSHLNASVSSSDSCDFSCTENSPTSSRSSNHLLTDSSTTLSPTGTSIQTALETLLDLDNSTSQHETCTTW